MFQENYAILCNTITEIEDLLEHFKIEHVITSDEEEQIKNIPGISDKTRRVMLNISTSLEAGNNNKFDAMLKVMKNYGSVSTQHLAELIESRLKDLSTSTCLNTVCQAQQRQRQLVTGFLYVKDIVFIAYMPYNQKFLWCVNFHLFYTLVKNNLI